MRAMGLDIGSVTVGVSLSDGLKMIASSYTVIRYENEDDALFKRIVDIIKEQAYHEGFVKGERDGFEKFQNDASEALKSLETLASSSFVTIT